MGQKGVAHVVPASTYPVLTLRDIVIFPGMIVPLFVGRKRSVAALEHAVSAETRVFLATQKDSQQDDPLPGDAYASGVLARIAQILKLPDGTIKVLIEGEQRAVAHHYIQEDPFLEAEIHLAEETPLESSSQSEALVRTVLGRFEQYIRLSRKIGLEVLEALRQLEDPGQVADTIVAHLGLKISDKQAILEAFVIQERLEKILALIESEINVFQIEKKLRGRVKKQVEKTQREYYLNEQLKAIQKELGEAEEPQKDDLAQLEEAIRTLKLSPEAREKALVELKKLRQMSPMSAESTVVRNYLDWLLSIPWMKKTKIRKDIAAAQKVLNQDHYGLEKIKERILEYLAVQARVGKIKGPILCLVGPPGVGKTSLGKSIARATGRNFVRMSLGGVRDEAEIRGHRRTYVGAMPGKIVQGMKKAKSSNPLFLLDEIDKLGQDWRGDPSSALLEVLDPEQNNTFNDHYLEVDYDLSDIMFVTTANTLNMPQPLLDRMEIIRLSGYTEDEKLEIAKHHLIPRQLKEHGLKKTEWSITDDALRDIIRFYTLEAGVRHLERELSKLCRKAVKEMAMSADHSLKKVALISEKLQQYLGPRKYRHGEIETKDLIGVTTGLAWTEVGGELLSIEAVAVPGKGKLQITGKLGDVMQESAQAAASYIRYKAHTFGIHASRFDQTDLHIHVPEGATPKDGPSAGVAMCTSIISALTGIPLRRDVAMTGEITLRGRVLPIGGLKEKLLAAHRGGIALVIIPRENEKDLVDIPDNVKEKLEIRCVDTVDEVLETALTQETQPLSVEEIARLDQVAQARAISHSGNATLN